MEFKSSNMNCVTEHRALEIISKVGSLAMIGEIVLLRKGLLISLRLVKGLLKGSWKKTEMLLLMAMESTENQRMISKNK